MRCLAPLTFAATAFLTSVAAYADPLDGSSLPAGTRWVMHLDVDGARLATPLWDLARVKLVEPRRAELGPNLALLERIMGTRVPEDLHDVTLYGDAFDGATACVRLHAVMDKGNIMAFLRDDPAYTAIDYNGHDIISWRDKQRDRIMYAGFDAHTLAGPADTRAVVSADAQAVKTALDAMDGKAVLKDDSPLSPPPPSPVSATAPRAAQPILWMAALGLSELPRLQNVESPLISQLDAASVAVRWTNERASTEVRLTARSDKAAQQMQAIAEGVKAYVALSAADVHALPRTRMLAAALQPMTLTTEGSTVKGEWTVEVDKLEMLLNVALQEQAAHSTAGASTTKP